ncbi:MAG: hypothetical protein Q4E49_06545, partial [Bacteroidales bacterium]|nr:hypothetical protein [Bacteroidales bacterium]
ARTDFNDKNSSLETGNPAQMALSIRGAAKETVRTPRPPYFGSNTTGFWHHGRGFWALWQAAPQKNHPYLCTFAPAYDINRGQQLTKLTKYYVLRF